MSSNLPVIFEHLLPHLSPALTPPARERLARLAGVIPPIPRGIFECHLRDASTRVDFGLSIARAEAGFIAQPFLPAAATALPAWQRVIDFGAHWADPASRLGAAIPSLWLEFDLDGVAPPRLAPSLFFMLKRRGLEATEAREVTEAALRELLAESHETALRVVRRCFEVAASFRGHGDVGKIHQVGVMLARPGSGVRLCVAALPPDLIVHYLEAVGWRGRADLLAALVDWLRDRVDRLDLLDLDIQEGQVQPRIGLEVLFDKHPPGNPRESAWLAELVARGACAPAWRDTVLAWPGYTHLAPGPQTELRLQQQLVKRRVSHFKLVHQPPRPLEAKAYLWFDQVEVELRPTLSAGTGSADES